ncbi:hypothetical protein KC19_11G034900 [Ceratodon purpureus]|uniref:Uncharacterized protein n=1 Tax=Ceratodon purpureus TaxID=3225 RepID=A0A8T0GCH5_CERPU|nr:hypothetical protein KC19_11G034900 [Ceratodon purpureus]
MVQVFAKDPKDIPEWLKGGHLWLRPVEFNKLPKHQLMVRMCCPKCEEKVVEEIWEAPGVFDVRASWMDKKVVVIAMPEPIVLDEDVVLRRARRIDRKAKFVALDPSERSKISHKPEEKPNPKLQGGTPPPPTEYRPRTEYRALRPPSQIPHEPPHQVDNTPFYFLLFIVMLVAMYIFRK